MTPKKSPSTFTLGAGRPCRNPCRNSCSNPRRNPRRNPRLNLGAGRPRPSCQIKCCAMGRRGLKPCKKMSENGMPRFESLQKIPTENSRPEARGKKKSPRSRGGPTHWPGSQRSPLEVWGTSRPKYPPMSANGPQVKPHRM